MPLLLLIQTIIPNFWLSGQMSLQSFSIYTEPTYQRLGIMAREKLHKQPKVVFASVFAIEFEKRLFRRESTNLPTSLI